MTKYDKELDTRTEEYEEAVEPLERESETLDEQRREHRREEDGGQG